MIDESVDTSAGLGLDYGWCRIKYAHMLPMLIRYLIPYLRFTTHSILSMARRTRTSLDSIQSESC